MKLPGVAFNIRLLFFFFDECMLGALKLLQWLGWDMTTIGCDDLSWRCQYVVSVCTVVVQSAAGMAFELSINITTSMNVIDSSPLYSLT